MVGEDDLEKMANLNYLENYTKMKQVPVPTFAHIQKNCLFLNELRFNDEMSLALSQYLKAIKDSPEKRVKCLSIDNCSMKDAQFAQILEGIAAQGQHI